MMVIQYDDDLDNADVTDKDGDDDGDDGGGDGDGDGDGVVHQADEHHDCDSADEEKTKNRTMIPRSALTNTFSVHCVSARYALLLPADVTDVARPTRVC